MDRESYIRAINDLLHDADVNDLELCLGILKALKGVKNG